MTDGEHNAYVAAFNKVFEGCLEPDVYIALKASEKTVIERIRNRERYMELKMLEKYPEYFRLIVREFNSWLKKKQKEDDCRVNVIDNDRFDYAHDGEHRQIVINATKNWLNYYLLSPSQRNGIGSDGVKLIIPTTFRTTPNLIDRAPGQK